MTAKQLSRNSPKSASGGSKEGRKENYYAYKALTNPKVIKLQDKIISHFGIRYATLRDLLTIYIFYTSNNTGINPNGILKSYDKTDGAFRVLFHRLTALQDKGLIYNEKHLYYPTEKAIKELQSFS